MNENVEKLNNNDCLKPIKFVRDLVLGYVYLTKFDLKIIDTLEFQRLKDIRQLTCQHVFPAARHTRFEHSLGVMELTRRALKNLNRNGFLSDASLDSEGCVDMSEDDTHSVEKEVIFNSYMQFNAALAALLHDVGHCPFSHLGESEMNEVEVWNSLYNILKNYEELKDSSLCQKFETSKKLLNDTKDDKKIKDIIKEFGAKHEQLSCIVILEKFAKQHLNIGEDAAEFDDKSAKKVDLELIIRSILGVKYDVPDSEKNDETKKKNVIVNLINSSVFDLDKLDYVMRDSWYTGIGAPKVDTHRLFRNMYLNNKKEFSLVFTNRAVPSLQNLIESRDELYMYVYNHHTSVYSDFMFGYIFRRLTHNVKDLLSLKSSHADDLEINENDFKKYFDIGLVPQHYLFSPDAVLKRNCSDSDFISLLNYIRNNLSAKSSEEIKQRLQNIMSKRDVSQGNNDQYNDTIYTIVQNIQRTHKLIEKYQKREYLKPWWKTSSEFNNFIKTNFLDDPIRIKLCNWICKGEGKLKSDEFCSQLAKNVSYITRNLSDDAKEECGLIAPFENDEFFVIRRSSHFFDTKTISQLDIALKKNEMLGSNNKVKYYSGNFYIKSLTNVIPQRDYYSMYAENSFYIFSKLLDGENNEDTDDDYDSKRRRHYHFIEKIFVFVATTLINGGVSTFQENYGEGKGKLEEENAHKKMLALFKEYENIQK